jgi:hypothetical protein
LPFHFSSTKTDFSELKVFLTIILATQEAGGRKIMVQTQPRQIVHKTLSPKKLNPKKDW